jgi:hypothetical protein
MRFLLPLWLLLSCLVWARPDYKQAYVTRDGARLRRGPGESAAVVGHLHRGDWLGVLGRRGSWLEVVPLRAWVRTSQLVDGKIPPAGLDLLLEPRSDAVKLGSVKAADVGETILHQGKTYTMLEAPSSYRYWIADSLVSLRGLPVPELCLVSPHSVAVSDADYLKLAALRKGGLRYLVLPTRRVGVPKLEIAESSERFGPHYQVRYQVGSEWLIVAGATSGLGGPDLSEPRYLIRSELLGTVIVGPQNYGTSKEFLGLLPEIVDGSGYGGKPFPLTMIFSCSPGLQESVIRQAIESLRAVRL